ncbi:hypothetical protein H0E84_19155 [Luteimonas sp. SJ-92]|uniref:Tle cognate immunity protein 4 C-terminal domain-containing protein n=1 Tax=Luteimonas salinisoli TaxID=2752307 RepID=A0A853JGJ5_9GAMM|nr:T6SS immunity protein Tli4 family protein [Luteimonas salinisoli]NZA28496.1 hypothetical protein [Luteimonas salinisoli]
MSQRVAGIGQPHAVRILVGLMMTLVAGCGGSPGSAGFEGVDLAMGSLAGQAPRTHCVGRFLVDLPESFRPSHSMGGGAGEAIFYFGRDADFHTMTVTSFAQRVTSVQFDAVVAARSEELARGTNYESNTSMLSSQEAWSPTETLLSHYASVDVADAQVRELHVLVEDAHVAITTTAYDAAQLQDAEARLRDMLERVRRVGDPASAGRGLCLGAVVVDADSDYEELQLGFRAEGRAHSDVRFQISLDTFRPPDDEPTLIARGEANLAGLGVKPKTLKKGECQLAGMEGEQWLGRFEEEGRPQHGFYAETNVRSPSPRQPKLMVEMFTGGEDASGGPAASSLGDEEAIALWETIVASLRERPGA